MPVIGRLDGQVEEVIIKPVGRRHAPDQKDAPETASDSSITPRDEPRDTHHENRFEPSSDKRHGDDEELPVWLL